AGGSTVELVLVVVVLFATEVERQEWLIDRDEMIGGFRHELVDELEATDLHVVLTGSGRRRRLIRTIERQPLIGRDLRNRRRGDVQLTCDRIARHARLDELYRAHAYVCFDRASLGHGSPRSCVTWTRSRAATGPNVAGVWDAVC